MSAVKPVQGQSGHRQVPARLRPVHVVVPAVVVVVMG
jgi:hypothetical protein